MPDSSVKRDPLTPEELDLLATPDEELRNWTKTFSFDRERFNARISSGERWQQLLQAHLYFDHVITQLLVDDALANPDVINAQRMGFVQKLQLIQALGLLNSDLVPPVEFINGLRNKIAHDLSFEISDKDESDLANCTPKFLRDVVVEDSERSEGAGPVRFWELLHVPSPADRGHQAGACLCASEHPQRCSSPSYCARSNRRHHLPALARAALCKNAGAWRPDPHSKGCATVPMQVATFGLLADQPSAWRRVSTFRGCPARLDRADGGDDRTSANASPSVCPERHQERQACRPAVLELSAP